MVYGFLSWVTFTHDAQASFSYKLHDLKLIYSQVLLIIKCTTHYVRIYDIVIVLLCFGLSIFDLLRFDEGLGCILLEGVNKYLLGVLHWIFYHDNTLELYGFTLALHTRQLFDKMPF